MANLPMPEGLEVQDLECVMLTVEELDIHRAMGEAFNEDDLFYGTTPRLKYAQGAVSEFSAHVTLLFGIHPSDDYEMDVHLALENWDLPDVLIEKIGFFPSTVEGEDYVAIVAHVVKSAQLIAGNKLLQELPHTNEFEYSPHITLVYLKGTADKDAWISRLEGALGFKIVHSLGIDLGND